MEANQLFPGFTFPRATRCVLGKAAETRPPLSGVGTPGLWRHLQGIERQGLLSVAVQAGVLAETELGRAKGMGVREPGVHVPAAPMPHTALSAGDLGLEN